MIIAYDTIAPVTQDTERRDENEGNTDTHPDLNETYDVSEDLGIPRKTWVQVLLLAATGKAAYLIKGNTIHSTNSSEPIA